MADSPFPAEIFVTLTPAGAAGEETLESYFDASDIEDAGPVAVYELKSVGQVERRFVPAVEQYDNARCETFHKAGA